MKKTVSWSVETIKREEEASLNKTPKTSTKKKKQVSDQSKQQQVNNNLRIQQMIAMQKAQNATMRRLAEQKGVVVNSMSSSGRSTSYDNSITKEKPKIVKSYSSTMESNGGMLKHAGDRGSSSSHAGDSLTSRNNSRHSQNENLHEKVSIGSTNNSQFDNITNSEKKQQYMHQTLSMDDGTNSSISRMLSNDSNTSSNNNSGKDCKLLKWSFYLLLGGTILGLILPKNTNIPSHSWQILSNIVGYTYFLAWSASFYPQILLNYNRRTTRGLSVDFCVLNVLGYICYTIYTTNFYFNENVISEYKDRNSVSTSVIVGEDGGDTTQQIKGEVTVQGNDVAFAIHAIIMASITLSQIGIYDTFAVRPPSKRVYVVLFCTMAFCLTYILGTWIYQGKIDVLGFLYVLGTIKICVTIGKYVPQALLNRSRKSTVGWNVSQCLRMFINKCNCISQTHILCICLRYGMSS